MTFFEENGVLPLRHPACSPDLNPIENVWRWMARDVYGSGKQFATVNELRYVIIRAGTTFPQATWKPSFLVCHKQCLRFSTKIEAVLITKFNFAYFNVVIERFPRISYGLIILVTCKHITRQKCQFLNKLLTQTFYVFPTFYL